MLTSRDEVTVQTLGTSHLQINKTVFVIVLM